MHPEENNLTPETPRKLSPRCLVFDNPNKNVFSRERLQLFQQVVQTTAAKGYHNEYVRFGPSLATVSPKTQLDMTAFIFRRRKLFVFACSVHYKLFAHFLCIESCCFSFSDGKVCAK